jgi:DNA-binding MarR family transcriptional regulator
MTNVHEPPDREGAGPHRLADTAVWLLGRASVRASRLAHERLASDGVRKWHYAVLATVKEFGPAAQAEIGRRLGLDRSDMVTVLNDLEREGYVTRDPDPADRRRNSVQLTPAGHTALGHFDQLIRAADEELLTPLSAAERELLLKALDRIVHGA